MLSHGFLIKEEARMRDEAYESAMTALSLLASAEKPGDLNLALMSLVYACAHLQGAIALRDAGNKALHHG